jgi:hypothetical protein
LCGVAETPASEEAGYSTSASESRTMKVLYNWLKEFVELTATPEDLRTRLSLSGTAVEALEQTAAGRCSTPS